MTPPPLLVAPCITPLQMVNLVHMYFDVLLTQGDSSVMSEILEPSISHKDMVRNVGRVGMKEYEAYLKELHATYPEYYVKASQVSHTSQCTQHAVTALCCGIASRQGNAAAEQTCTVGKRAAGGPMLRRAATARVWLPCLIDPCSGVARAAGDSLAVCALAARTAAVAVWHRGCAQHVCVLRGPGVGQHAQVLCESTGWLAGWAGWLE